VVFPCASYIFPGNYHPRAFYIFIYNSIVFIRHIACNSVVFASAFYVVMFTLL